MDRLIVRSMNPYRRGILSTVDLLVLTSLDKLILILKIIFLFFTKQASLIRRSTALSLPPKLVFPGIGNSYRRGRLSTDSVQLTYLY